MATILDPTDIYTDNVDPNNKVNPPKQGSVWINNSNGDISVCTDNSLNANKWVNKYSELSTKIDKQQKTLEEKIDKTVTNLNTTITNKNVKYVYLKDLIEPYKNTVNNYRVKQPFIVLGLAHNSSTWWPSTWSMGYAVATSSSKGWWMARVTLSLTSVNTPNPRTTYTWDGFGIFYGNGHIWLTDTYAYNNNSVGLAVLLL